MKPITELDMGKYEVAAFDWDGTLVDSPKKYRKLDQLFISGYYGTDVTMDEVRRDFNKKWDEYDGDNFWDYYFKFIDEQYGDGKKTIEEIMNNRKIYAKQVQKTIEYKPQAPEILRKMRENHTLKMVLATNSYLTDVNFIADNSPSAPVNFHPTEFFDKLWTYDDVENKKPHPEIYQKIMAHYAIRESGLIVFEDSLHGVQSAKNAGVEVVVIHDEDSDLERDEINDTADFYVRDWSEIEQAL